METTEWVKRLAGATLIWAEGQNLNFAIPVKKVSAALAKPPSEQVGSSALPIPTPAQTITGKTPFDSGIALLEKKEYEKAIDVFTDAIRIDPNNALAYCHRGAYFYKGNYENAIRDFDDAIRLDPSLALAFNGRAAAHNGQGKFDEAISDYAEAIRLKPNDADAYVLRGSAYVRRGELDKAKAVMQRQTGSRRGNKKLTFARKPAGLF